MKAFRMRTVLAGFGAALALSTAASAATYTEAADTLRQLNLFRGTEAGYDLDRAPTRAEAATMLVRLLGKEREALSLAYTAPFADVPDWAKPYVQYLYQNRLTNGVSEAAFAPSDACNAQMYTAFLLRSLAYSEQAGDFTYDGAIGFAQTLGLYDSRVMPAVLLRDHIVAQSYIALGLSQKGSEQMLLQSLIEQGAVAPQAAADLLSFLTDWRSYAAAFSPATAPYSFTHQTEAKTNLFALSGTEHTTINPAENSAETERTLTISLATGAPQTQKSKISVKDGAVTTTVGDSVTDEPLSADNAPMLLGAARPLPSVFIRTISGNAAEGYRLLCSAAGTTMLTRQLDAAATAIGDAAQYEISDFQLLQRLKDGQLAEQTAHFSFTSPALSGTVASHILRD